jgi:mannose-1-phosphate guanylyltransferase / mannose-6-phosphate isomerase
MKLIPTILCGGAGSRLWPVSREMHPKSFIRLADGQSLLQKAYLRAAALPAVSEIVTVTNHGLYFKIQDEYRDAGDTGLAATFLLEPFGRNTAPAIAAATLSVASTHGDDALLLVLTADHLISDQSAFAQAVGEAVRLAGAGRIATFGIRADAPETAYGYIEHQGSRVVRFVEKPPLDQDRSYVASGKYLWNSGMFLFSAGTMRREMQRHCPDILKGVAACLERSRVSGGERSVVELDVDSFERVPELSIDYALMERSGEIAVVPCAIGWSDVGSWNALGSLVEPDAAGNRVEGEALLHDVSNSYIRSEGRMVGALGVDNLMVIDTPDALLVADRGRAEDVKKLYAELKAAGHESHKVHRTTHRPWGTYTVLEEGTGFKIKRIEVKPGASLSLQLHRHRSEHWVVVSGTARVFNGGNELDLVSNQSTFIPPGHKHRLSNPGAERLVIIEVQTGGYLGEDDIVRFDDVYGRAAKQP